MESLGEPGRVQVTHAAMERLVGDFVMEARGLIDVKGKGPTPTYFLVRRADSDDPNRADSRGAGG
jgi:adenylate cyclase